MYAARQLSQLRGGLAEFVQRRIKQLNRLRRIGGQLVTGEAHVDAERHQSLLAPSCRLRSMRRRCSSPASTMRALDARSSATRARSSASRRSFLNVSSTAALTVWMRLPLSATDALWITAARGSPSWLMSDATAPSSGSGRSTGEPSESTYEEISGTQ